MNYLAHLHLAGPTEASRIGNLLGDFVKGTPASLADRYPADVLSGIVMHRKIDRFTDAHEQFRRARQLLAPERRRFAGIVVDIFFDHFLTRHWSLYSGEPLEQFIERAYTSIERHPEWLSPELAAVVPRMRGQDWLHSYKSLEGVGYTLYRVARRSPRTATIRQSTDDLTENYHVFEDCFLNFYPDALAYAATLLSPASQED